MNCDQVFGILTRGPFPTGHPSDVDVERHLARCGDCRRLADALRPALELDQESISSDESRDLPGYWAEMLDHGPLRSASHPLALVARVPAALHQRIDRGRNWIARRTGRNGLRFTAAVFVGAAVGLLLRNAAEVVERPDYLAHSNEAATPTSIRESAIGPLEHRAPREPVQHRDAAISSMPQQQVTAEAVRRRLLTALTLAPACFGIDPLATDETGITPPEGVRLWVQADVSQVHCCTECHAKNSESVSAPAAKTTVTRSCSICHQ